MNGRWLRNTDVNGGKIKLWIQGLCLTEGIIKTIVVRDSELYYKGVGVAILQHSCLSSLTDLLLLVLQSLLQLLRQLLELISGLFSKLKFLFRHQLPIPQLKQFFLR